jgi:hypothetical protein
MERMRLPTGCSLNGVWSRWSTECGGEVSTSGKDAEWGGRRDLVEGLPGSELGRFETVVVFLSALPDQTHVARMGHDHFVP